MAAYGVDDVAGLATAFCALLAMGYDDQRRAAALLMIALVIWAAGVAGVSSVYNAKVPDRALLIDRALTMHLVVLPVYAYIYMSRSDPRQRSYRAAGGCALATFAIIAYALVAEGASASDSIVYAFRGVVVALVALMAVVLTPAPTRIAVLGGYQATGGTTLLITTLVAELLYVGALAHFKPVGASTTETLTNAIGRAPPAEPSAPSSCAPMCVGAPTDENACYAHNARLAELYREAALNAKNGVPEMSGMTNAERACMRAHPIGSQCTFCQGHGCMRGPVDGVLCTDTPEAHSARLATVNEESKRQVASGFGVLTLEEQLAQARSATLVGAVR